MTELACPDCGERFDVPDGTTAVRRRGARLLADTPGPMNTTIVVQFSHRCEPEEGP